MLDFNVYATLQTSAGDLQHDPATAFEPAAAGFHEDMVDVSSDLDGPPSPARATPPACPKPSTAPPDRPSVDDVPLLADAEATSSPDVPSWENFADLEFPRDALDPIDTLGNSSFGEVITTACQNSTQCSGFFFCISQLVLNISLYLQNAEDENTNTCSKRNETDREYTV